ncbi:SAF domain-containing protein [Sinomonas atrocyanea]|uniref:SAF domain-containing protein n=1 Tax=Sinomonas atrocyanea TaxID=37927 RepID=UPI003D989551
MSRPSWKDPRLLVGLLLVLASTAGVVALVDAADATVPVYSAKEDIAVGQPIDAALLEQVDVRLGDVEGRYLRAGTPPEGRVALQRVAKGDLVPASSLGEPRAVDRKPVSISAGDSLPAEALPGTRVDVWVALPDGRNGFAEPVLLVPGAEIAHREAASSTLGGSRETRVLVLVDDARLPKLLGAQANEAKVSLVWNPAGGTR